MYEAGDLLKFSPFKFKNGNQPKPKYFPRQTFVYGEQVDEYETKYLDEMDSSVENLGKIESQIFHDLKDCIKKAQSLRRKYRNLL